MGFHACRMLSFDSGLSADICDSRIELSINLHLRQIYAEGWQMLLGRRKQIYGGKSHAGSQMFSVNHAALDRLRIA